MCVCARVRVWFGLVVLFFLIHLNILIDTQTPKDVFGGKLKVQPVARGCFEILWNADWGVNHKAIVNNLLCLLNHRNTCSFLLELTGLELR